MLEFEIRNKAHPTFYGDVQFRSRLEARWAAWFDIAGWRWEYEPSDDKGWVPDFVLPASGIAVEVKPIEWASKAQAILEIGARTDLAKVRESTRMFVLVLGSFPIVIDSYEPIIGMVVSKAIEHETCPIMGAKLVRGRNCLFDMRLDDQDDYGAWFGSGEFMFRNERDPVHGDTLANAWRLAGNRVQWRAPVRRSPLVGGLPGPA
jgi:hypothetical protein